MLRLTPVDSLARGGGLRSVPDMPARVLVVDDDRDIRECLVQILTEEGFDVTSASNGREALDEIERAIPHVMLLDLMMPVMNGWEVMETLRLSTSVPKFPIVVLSAIEARGCADYIPKPIRLPRLLELLATVRAKAAASASMRAAAPIGAGDAKQ
jgi:CheY-like chemotaxis protein